MNGYRTGTFAFLATCLSLCLVSGLPFTSDVTDSANAATGGATKAIDLLGKGAKDEELRMAVEKGLLVWPSMATWDSYITEGQMLQCVKRLRSYLVAHGMNQKDFPPLPEVTTPNMPLVRDMAVFLVVTAVIPDSVTVSWSNATLRAIVPDYDDVRPECQRSVALAAEHNLFNPPVRSRDPADMRFAASLLVRMAAYGQTQTLKGCFSNEIRRAIAFHILYPSDPFDAEAPVTAQYLESAIQRARQYLPENTRMNLPEMTEDTGAQHSLTRLEAIVMVAHGLIADHRVNPQCTATDENLDPALTNVESYLSVTMDNGHPWIDEDDYGNNLNALAAVVYKGWLPNGNFENGMIGPAKTATFGYIACMLARAVSSANEYSGIIIDLSGLGHLDRCGSMWIMASTDDGSGLQRIAPSSKYQPLQPYSGSPGVQGYYGSVESAEQGRAGSHPLIIKAIDWARYDWSYLHGAPGLRRGGGSPVSLASYEFKHGTPPLIIISAEDADRMIQADRQSMLIRMFRVALVHPSWAMH